MALLAARGDAAALIFLRTRDATLASATPIRAAAASTTKSRSRAWRPGTKCCATSTAAEKITSAAMVSAVRLG
jgi:hypothetical protein